MISSFLNLASSNDGATKKVSVAALSDASGGMETFQFQILDQAKTVQVNFAANQWQTVSVVHTATGKGTVSVKATGSLVSETDILDVDKQPEDAGTGS